MALSCASMAAEVQALCGRTGDTVLITADQLATWFNEAQQDIVDRIPGLHALTFKNTTSLDVTGKVRYALTDVSAGDYTAQTVAHVWNVFYLDGVDSARLNFVHTDQYDAEWIDPSHADSPTGKPSHWTRRGQYIELRPLAACAYWNDDLRLDGDFYPRDFTAGDSTKYSDLSQADEGLKDYALSKAWRAIGSEGGGSAALLRAGDYSGQYEQWLDTYERRNNRLEEWPGNLYDDDIA